MAQLQKLDAMAKPRSDESIRKAEERKKQREVIDRACEWLEKELRGYIMEGREGRPYISVALIDEFKKAMYK